MGDSLARSGTYEHTFEELQWGARAAWRNHGKSVLRSHWNELMLLDHRAADTLAKMFEVRSARCCWWQCNAASVHTFRRPGSNIIVSVRRVHNAVCCTAYLHICRSEYRVWQS